MCETDYFQRFKVVLCTYIVLIRVRIACEYNEHPWFKVCNVADIEGRRKKSLVLQHAHVAVLRLPAILYIIIVYCIALICTVHVPK